MHWTALLLLLAILPHAGASEVQGATFDLFQGLVPSMRAADASCGVYAEGLAEDGLIIDTSDGFRFEEGSGGGFGGLPDFEPPLTRTPCAMARFPLTVPDGTGHMHVRFDASRSVEQNVTLPYQVLQRLLVLGAQGEVLFSEDYYAPDAPSQSRTRFADVGDGDTDLIDLPPGTRNVTVAWLFQDQGRADTAPGASLVSGQVVTARVWTPWVEFSGYRPETSVTSDDHQDGATRWTETRVQVRYDAEVLDTYRPNLRLRVGPEMQLSHVVLPDGSRFDDQSAFRPGEEYSQTLGRIILEPRPPEFLQVTVPSDVAAAGGPGVYTVVFRETQTYEEVPALQWVNALVLLVPFGFAVTAYRHIAAFRREAFGAYSRSAGNLMVTLGLVTIYYAAVLVGAGAAGWLSLMSVWPPGREAALLYVQVAIAIAAFIGLWRTGQALHAITAP